MPTRRKRRGRRIPRIKGHTQGFLRRTISPLARLGRIPPYSTAQRQRRPTYNLHRSNSLRFRTFVPHRKYIIDHAPARQTCGRLSHGFMYSSERSNSSTRCLTSRTCTYPIGCPLVGYPHLLPLNPPPLTWVYSVPNHLSLAADFTRDAAHLIPCRLAERTRNPLGTAARARMVYKPASEGLVFPRIFKPIHLQSLRPNVRRF